MTQNIFNPVPIGEEPNTDDEADDDADQEEAQKSLKEADFPNDKEFIEEAANASSSKDNQQEPKKEYFPSDDEPDFSNPGPPPKLNAGEAFAGDWGASLRAAAVVNFQCHDFFVTFSCAG